MKSDKNFIFITILLPSSISEVISCYHFKIFPSEKNILNEKTNKFPKNGVGDRNWLFCLWHYFSHKTNHSFVSLCCFEKLHLKKYYSILILICFKRTFVKEKITWRWELNFAFLQCTKIQLRRFSLRVFSCRMSE